MTLFDRIGAAGLRAVITDFYGRVFGDVMIGFMFDGKDRQRLVDREFELAARMLGAADIAYTGKPMRAAHAHVPIMGGHFERRMQLMREVMRDHAVDPEIQATWLAHQESLRSQVTSDKGSECRDTRTVPPAPVVAPQRIVTLGRKR